MHTYLHLPFPSTSSQSAHFSLVTSVRLGAGWIRADDFALVIRKRVSLGREVFSDGDVTALFKLADVSGEGKLDTEDFIEWVDPDAHHVQLKRKLRILADDIDFVDVFGDVRTRTFGQLTYEEFAQVLREDAGMSARAFSNSAIMELFSELDPSDKGHVHAEDFLHWLYGGAWGQIVTHVPLLCCCVTHTVLVFRTAVTNGACTHRWYGCGRYPAFKRQPTSTWPWRSPQRPWSSWTSGSTLSGTSSVRPYATTVSRLAPSRDRSVFCRLEIFSLWSCGGMTCAPISAGDRYNSGSGARGVCGNV
jgi:Ca2+-binding EF-hand superfamily protein